MYVRDDLIYDITKEYKDMFKVVVYKYPFDPSKNKNKKKKKLKINTDSDESIRASVSRSRSAISDYVMSNDFDLFVTFTFDPRKVDRYDMTAVYLKMQSWLWRQSRKSKEFGVDFKYVIVPEKHKDGAIHFHALMFGYTFPLKKTKVIQNNKRVYNVTSFRFGFTNAQYLDDERQKATAYLCKYITKDMVKVANRRRYWCSKNLMRPVGLKNRIYNLGLMSKLTHQTLVYESEYNVIYNVPKDMFV